MRRNGSDQSFHDRVVRELAHELGVKDEDAEVCANPGSAKNCDVGGLYPDVVVVRPIRGSRRRGGVEHIYEVETEDSVSETEALRQWLPYSEIGVDFTLVVPKRSVDDAMDLLVTHGIDADVLPYVHLNSGEILFKWPE